MTSLGGEAYVAALLARYGVNTNTTAGPTANSIIATAAQSSERCEPGPEFDDWTPVGTFSPQPPPCPIFDPERLPIGRVYPARIIEYVDSYEAEAGRDRIALLENRAITHQNEIETKPIRSSIEMSVERQERENA